MAYPYRTAYLPPPRPVRRRRRWPWVLLVVLALLVGIGVAADRIALAVAEDKAGQALQSSQHLAHTPDVSVAGFPFLTQLLARHFDEITVSVPDVTVGEQRTLRIANITVYLHDITISGSYRTIRARTASAAATISYADLSATLGVPVRANGADRIVAAPNVRVLGRTFSGRVTAIVHASSAGGITFTDPQVSAGATTLPGAASQALAQVFARPISLAGLPFSVRVDGVDVIPTGIVLRLSGSDVTYTRS